MTHVYAFLAPGLEEVECLATVDLLVRAGIKVHLISITDSPEVTGSHGFTIKTDGLLGNVEWEQADVLFCPGGMPGTTNLAQCRELTDHLVEAYKNGKRLAAICAGPSVFGGLGLLEGKKATCYPGFEDRLTGAAVQKEGVVTDGQITTAKGLGYALDLGLELVRILVDPETAAKLKTAIQYDR